ncbi:helicase C-terminal domain-containing protein [Fructilactobacillus fructivorans]|uniref:helicase C-terminal domain-containing protein n=1 Tax=Fructilactobacillus fructivorans TaxID=1614 RepID=UPI0039E13D5E
MVNKVGVRDLVEFLLRSGDLNSSLSSLNTAQAGTRIHHKLQKNRPKDYQKEYYLEKAVQVNHNDFLVHGRADGVILNDDSAVIEEIKTSDIEFQDIPENKMILYWGQVKAYAYLLMNENPAIKTVTMRLTYVQTPEEETTQKEQSITFTDAESFFNNLIKEFSEWLKLKDQLDEEKHTTAQKLQFPFKEYRDGQHELAAAVYKTVVTHRHLFAEAPTGTGKTISTLFPTIKAMGNDLISKVFYLTAKQSTRRVAEDAIRLMSDKGLRLRSITLTAKDQIMFEEERDQAPEDNPYMIGYYDRLKPALKDLLRHNHQITRDIIEKYAKKYTLDPFEFSLDTSLFCDVIIGDYNYLFDPQVHLQRFFEVQDYRNFYLIDEAHNLVDRSREMYSTELSSSSLADVIKIISRERESNKKVLTKLRSLKRQFNAVAKPLRDDHIFETATDDPLDKFTKAVTNLVKVMRKWIAKQDDSDDLDVVLDFFFQCTGYLKISEYFGPNYKVRILLDGKNVTVCLFCMDPSHDLAETLKLGGGAVLFSATLSPMDYYAKVLGDEPDSLKYELPSPFSPENQSIIVTSYINTTFRNRDQSIAKIVATINQMVTAKKGNYLIFAPSGLYLEKIYAEFIKQHPTIHTIKQESGMDDQARSRFIHQFDHPDDQSTVGFALLGGIFSEGIDLVGDKLIGVGIVGVGLPGLNSETNLIRDYFDAKNGHGFEYAYQLPGLNHVFQAAGRLIRGKHDQGVIVLMDQRFTQKRYTNLYPPQWKNYHIAHSPRELENDLHQFWNHLKGESHD